MEFSGHSESLMQVKIDSLQIGETRTERDPRQSELGA